jgi:hypothetical protein
MLWQTLNRWDQGSGRTGMCGRFGTHSMGLPGVR